MRTTTEDQGRQVLRIVITAEVPLGLTDADAWELLAIPALVQVQDSEDIETWAATVSCSLRGPR